MLYRVIGLFIIVALLSCGGSDGGDSSSINSQTSTSSCGPFSDWSSSNYVLPYPVGTRYTVNQTNCSGFGHSGFWTYGYDFIMDIGTEVSAMRSGTVFHTQDGTSDGNPASTNLILIEHDDGTVALYSHLTNGGILVTNNQIVNAGDIIGLSGNTGNTGGLPHLHVSLHPCRGLPGLTTIPQGSCPTQAFNFRNTVANPKGLDARVVYEALEE